MKLFIKKCKKGFTPTSTFTIGHSIPPSFISRNIFKGNFLYKRKLVKGFTLVEMMVSVAIFSIVIVVGVGALYSAQSINIKLQATHIIMDGINLSLEVMTRNIRYGSSFYCASDLNDATGDGVGLSKNCLYSTVSTSGGGKIVFKPVSGGVNDRIAYYVDNNKHLTETLYVNGIVSTTKQISSDDLIIENLRFYVIGANKLPTDSDQPMVTLTISGKTKVSKTSQEVSFVLQSSVVTRNSD